MAVMVTFTLKADVETYQRMHPQLLPTAFEKGLLCHSGREVGGQVAILDFWPSAEAFNSFAEGPMAEGMKAGGLAAPDDVEITPLLHADPR